MSMKKEFFASNRQTLLQKLRCDLIILSSNVAMQRSNDASFYFEQEANFWWLTGINEPGWWVVIQKNKTSLVAPDIDEVHRIFDGALSDTDAIAQSGVDEVLSYADGELLMASLKEAGLSVAGLGKDPHEAHYDFTLNPGPVEMYTKLQSLFGTIKDCRKDVAQLRAIKQPEEIAAIREAINLTIKGFEKIRSDIDTYEHEYEIEADFTYHFRKSGAPGHAYDPIVAAGENAVTLHYGKNQDKLVPGQFVLMDIGARVDNYAADISRTYAYGEITDRQRAVHSAVEKAHKEIISLLKPGYSVKDYHEAVDEIMKDALSGLGLLNSPSDYRKYFPHSVSHGLGIDVHDSLGGPAAFQSGMVLTVEPGIYIPEEGIGVRIEDDILITETGNENLSAALPTSM